MPQLGESVTEGTIARWLVKAGDRVRRYDPLAEVITDKVTAEIPAPMDGVVVSVAVAEGTTVQVGAPIASMEPEGVTAAGPDPVPGGGAERPAARYSPAVLKLAQEHGVDLGQVTGSGLGGRITRKDVEAHIARGGTAAAAPAPAPAPGPAPEVPPPAAAAAPAAPAPLAADGVLPVTPVRRRIAEKMLQARREQPHAWTMIRVDVTGLARLRDQVQADFKAREGIGLSFLPFVIQAVCGALREFPLLNSTWAGDEILIRKDLNISIAVATADALAVPVIHQADRLSIAGLAHAIHDLAARARAGKLTLDDIQGGTFTVNNTGAFGSVLSQPILNYPQAAILTFEQVVREPVVVADDAIAIRHMVNLCCSLDHRILDGLVVGRFLQAVKRRLEAYAPGQAI